MTRYKLPLGAATAELINGTTPEVKIAPLLTGLTLKLTFEVKVCPLCKPADCTVKVALMPVSPEPVSARVVLFNVLALLLPVGAPTSTACTKLD